jgi:hypothetical protein
MEQSPHTSDDAAFPADDLINASELREFVYCERSWWLSRQGYAVSAKALQQRAAGIAFHVARAGAARRGSNANAHWWAIIMTLAALALWLGRSLLGTGQ